MGEFPHLLFEEQTLIGLSHLACSSALASGPCNLRGHLRSFPVDRKPLSSAQEALPGWHRTRPEELSGGEEGRAALWHPATWGKVRDAPPWWGSRLVQDQSSCWLLPAPGPAHSLCCSSQFELGLPSFCTPHCSLAKC